MSFKNTPDNTPGNTPGITPGNAPDNAPQSAPQSTPLATAPGTPQAQARRPWQEGQAILDDPRAMRAVAHPVRLGMLDYLGRVESATATECATQVDASPSACSYHLRALARWHLVEDAQARDGREHRWRKVKHGLSWSHRGRPELLAASSRLRQVFISRDLDLLEAYFRVEADLPPEWQDTLYAQATLVVTADELHEIELRLFDVLEPYMPWNREGGTPAGAREVNLAAFGVPRVDR
jgi:DNA-binding transcriptional ArsR family regulator